MKFKLYQYILNPVYTERLIRHEPLTKPAAVTVVLPLVPPVMSPESPAVSPNYFGPFLKLFMYSFTVLSMLGT